MASMKQVKVDNWGVFFLQRLKHFFNNTDYCDLTLQFKDFSQLKVHRLVLSACTKYFEALEHTCEVYDDCLIMPDDLQADVVVPIINFMYTGQLEYNYNLFDRLYSTALIMNMPVLMKLLDAHRSGLSEPDETRKKETVATNESLNSKLYSKTSTGDDFNNFNKVNVTGGRKYGPGPRLKYEPAKPSSKLDAARPTRYELPEGLEADEFFESSFSNISYESQPLMKPNKRRINEDDHPKNMYNEASTSDKFDELRQSFKRVRTSPSTSDATHVSFDQLNDYSYRQKSKSNYLKSEMGSDDDNQDAFDSLIMDYNRGNSNSKRASTNASNNLNDFQTQKSQKVTAKTDPKNPNISIDHAKIISEVLKKYPHLVKTNRNIKLKIMSGKSSSNSSSHNYVLETNSKGQVSSPNQSIKIPPKEDKADWIYTPRTGNSDNIAKLVALGAENTTGPWLCLLCGTPSKALRFLTYRAYYRHLTDIHGEKIPPKICEYCGFKSGKRNHLLHHMYTKHNIEPPPHYYFPKCSQCSYIALTEAFLIKHKLSHVDNKDFKCVICNASYKTKPQLLLHIQNTGHTLCLDRRDRGSAKCVYCNKVFLREANLYTHLKISHKKIAKRDGLIDNSDDEDDNYSHSVRSYNYTSDQQEEHVEIKEEYDGKIQIVSQGNKIYGRPQKLLNTKFADNSKKINEYESPVKQYSRDTRLENVKHNIDHEGTSRSNSSNINIVDHIVVFNDNEYILKADDEDVFDSNLKEQEENTKSDEFIIPDAQLPTEDVTVPQTRACHVSNINIVKRSQNLNQTILSQNQPVQIVMQNNQQYKTSSEKQDTDASKYASNQYESIQLENVSEGDVMVLNEEDFQMACSESISNDGSNIVVVYSHPVEKQYIQIDDQQFAGITNPLDIESQLAKVHGENMESVPISEPDIEHGTVEWQEESLDGSQLINDSNMSNIEQPTNQDSQSDVIKHDESMGLATPEPDIIERIDEKDDLQVEPTSTAEVVISSDQKQPEVSNENVIEADFNMSVENCIASETDQNSFNDAVEDIQNEKDIEKTDISTEEDNAHDYASQETADNNSAEIININKSVCDIANEWSDDDNSSKKEKLEGVVEENQTLVDEEHIEKDVLSESLEVHDEQMEHIECTNENNDLEKNEDLEENEELKKETEDVSKIGVIEEKLNDIIEENIQLSSEDQASDEINSKEVSNALMEVEESIENIQEEINKQEISTDPNQETANIPLCEDKNEESVFETEEMLIEHDKDDIQINDVIEDKKDDTIEKVTSVEKISHLLTEWEDTDSQSDVPVVTDNNKELANIPSNSNIEKLVSDWDEEDEK